MATTAQYTAQPIIECTEVGSGAASTSRSAPGASTPVEIATGPSVAGANGVGKRISKVTVVDVSTDTTSNTPTVVRFWLQEVNSNTYFLVCEKAIPANTPSSTAIGYRVEVPELVGLILPGHATDPASLWMTSHLASKYHVTVESGLL